MQHESQPGAARFRPAGAADLHHPRACENCSQGMQFAQSSRRSRAAPRAGSPVASPHQHNSRGLCRIAPRGPGWRTGRPGHLTKQEGDAMPDSQSSPSHAVSDRRSVREGWARDYRKRLNALARQLLFEEGIPWPQALAEATERLQCGARTKAGTPCRRAGRNPRTHRCEKHGASLGATTPAGRAKLSQIARSLPRGPDGRFSRLQVDSSST